VSLAVDFRFRCEAYESLADGWQTNGAYVLSDIGATMYPSGLCLVVSRQSDSSV